jgi:hypothetical protein
LSFPQSRKGFIFISQIFREERCSLSSLYSVDAVTMILEFAHLYL